MQPDYSPTPMIDDPYPETEQTRQAAREAQQRERAAAEAETGIRFDATGRPVIPRGLHLIYSKPLAAETAMQACDRVMRQEKLFAFLLADKACREIYGKELMQMDEQLERHLTAHARAFIRGLHQGWQIAARAGARDAMERAMCEDAGIELAQMDPAKRHALAVLLESVARAEYERYMRSSKPVPSGTYLAIVSNGGTR